VVCVWVCVCVCVCVWVCVWGGGGANASAYVVKFPTNIRLSSNRFKTYRYIYIILCRSQWLRCLRCRSAVTRLLRFWVRIPPEAWMSVCCKFCVLSGRGLCDELITSPEESYWLWCVVVCDLETSWMRRPCPTGGCCDKRKKYITF